MSSKPVSAVVEVPMSLDDRSAVAVEEIPLPPPELWGELENENASVIASDEVTKPTIGRRDIAKLDFVDGRQCRRVKLNYAFNDAERGQIDEMIVRRLTVGEVGDLLDNRPPNSPDNFDIYGLMTGFPAAVLRGLIDIDGEEVIGACYDFLPRLFRPALAEPPSTSANGEA